MEKLLEKLKIEIPEFYEFEEFDDLLYVDFGRLGSYLVNLINEYKSSNEEEIEELIRRIFNFFNRMDNDEENENLLVVSIYEVLITSQYGYQFAGSYFSAQRLKQMLFHFPKERYSKEWDTSTNYSEEDVKRIIDDL